MRITPICNNTHFSGIYKTDKKTISNPFVADYIAENSYPEGDNLVYTTGYNSQYNTYYILTKNDEKIEKELENRIKAGYGKYWKAEPLPDLWFNPNIAEAIFKNEKAINNGKENWVDYTKDKPKHTEDIPF